MNSDRKGVLGERAALRYFRANGYNILATNHKTYVGELDVVAVKSRKLHFIEVKARQQGGMFAPAEAVDRGKRENIKGSAAAYMNQNRLKMKYQFDIFEVYLDGDTVVSTNLIEDAF